MLLHIAEDEKFIDSAIENLESIIPNKNIYLIRIPSSDYKLRHITSKNIICATYNSKEYNETIYKYRNSDAIIFHNFINRYKWDLIKKLPKETTKVWIAWGADLYNSGKLADSYYKPITKKHARRLKKDKSTLKGPLRNILFELGSLVPLKVRIKLRITDNIENYLEYFDYMAPVIYEDYELLKTYYPKNGIKYIPFNYSGNISLYSNLEAPTSNGSNIIIGNSASPANNHLNTFELLRAIKLQPQQKIIVPLSYGGDEQYIAEIINRGKTYFGNRFLPITDFLPKKQYHELLSSVGYGFFDSLRQHAMGNINILFFMGAKVFMNKANPSYKFFQRINIEPRSLNNGTKAIFNELKMALTKEEQINNRMAINKQNNAKSYKKRMLTFIDTLTPNNTLL